MAHGPLVLFIYLFIHLLQFMLFFVRHYESKGCPSDSIGGCHLRSGL